MPAFFSVKQRVAAVVLVALGAISVTGLAPGWSGGEQGAAPTPLELFQKMLPVIRHDRCMNCHGGVDPISGTDHEGGMIKPPETCASCHKKNPDWHLPSPDHFFVGKTDLEVCALFADFASRMGHDFFISNHLEGDEFIIAAFEGWMGGARDPKDDEPDPPRIKQPAFVLLAKDWLTHGQAACDVQGTIYREESVTSTDTIPIAAGVETIVQQNGKRTVNITVRGGRYHAVIDTKGGIVTTQVQHLTDVKGRPCTFTSIDSVTYTGSTTGPAVVSITDLIFESDTHPPQTDYRIDVDLPPETGRRTGKGTIIDGCGTKMPAAEHSPETLEWDEVHFTLEGHVNDPTREGRVGWCDKLIKHSDVGSSKWDRDPSQCNRFAKMGNADTPGLMDHDDAHIAFHDGKEIPFRVVSRWNLKFK